MAIRIQDLTKKSFDHSSGLSVAHFSVGCPSWWNSREHQVSQTLSKNSSLKVESPPHLFHDGKYLGLQLADQESSSAQSIGQSHRDVSAVGGTNSQDQCISSESGQDESCGKGVEGQMKPLFLLSNSEIVFNPAHADYNQSMAHSLYPYGDRYFGGLYTPYGPQALIQPHTGSQMIGIASTRVPLPLDPAEDRPIYVNPKQYHGILRRRQSRAKLEAQNKLVKARKPYLHESRHLHAVNRVRGSGGRFLSSKKLQQPDPNSASGISDSNHFQKKISTSEFETHSQTMEYVPSATSCSDITSVSNSDVVLRQADRGFAGFSAHMGSAIQNRSRLVCSGMQHCASVVR
ncbi:nuclear transcription factor Y subunit A-3-like [Mangifera indica]|uniref:nuclear transcription factor Y subunit A-3-like n=1 Tax=Mangifera indica TaxID=29780 RepID=UPI001CFA9734|nr:nuclear transcription factor Y subunit A-3-like [Mangifera indica]